MRLNTLLRFREPSQLALTGSGLESHFCGEEASELHTGEVNLAAKISPAQAVSVPPQPTVAKRSFLPGAVLRLKGFPGGSDGKKSACNAGDLGSTLGSGRSPGRGCGNPLQYSCLENTMDRGAWRAIVHGVVKSGIPLSD